ncbi:MAG: protein kinase [Gemmataceae bacterium]|nr:protein kinase [Gemmataceae bacterium]
MPQVIRCPNARCQQTMQVPDNAAGKGVRCPKCQTPFTVPPPELVGAASASGRGVAAAAAAAGPGSRPSVNLPPVPSAPAPGAGDTTCPSCGSQLLPGAIACMDCGFLLQGDQSTAEPETPPALCTNPACGVANPPGERNCQRCGTPLPVAAGTMIHGRYRLDKLLAMGGFGAVYKATDTKTNREVAIKDMISGDPQEFAIRLNFFRREADILKMLEPVPIVPRVFDFIHQGQTAHLVIEFIRGTDLLKLMESRNNQAFPIPLVIEWAKAICDVLEHMHRQSPPLIHRDLKPDNIMLLEDQRSIKMIDFGTARDLGKTVKERMAGKTRVYTEGYAPPEQIVGKPEPRSDLFALAATLYHLATGKAPEGFYTAKELEQQLGDPASPLPQQFRWFFEVIKVNMAEDVNDRYFSAKEIKQDLVRQRVTKEQPCPKCKTPNKVRTPYCVKCAAALTDVELLCGSCGRNNRMGSRFCIYCGNRVR